MSRKLSKLVKESDLYNDDPLTRGTLITLANLADKYGKVNISEEELERAVRKTALEMGLVIQI